MFWGLFPFAILFLSKRDGYSSSDNINVSYKLAAANVTICWMHLLSRDTKGDFNFSFILVQLKAGLPVKAGIYPGAPDLWGSVNGLMLGWLIVRGLCLAQEPFVKIQGFIILVLCSDCGYSKVNVCEVCSLLCLLYLMGTLRQQRTCTEGGGEGVTWVSAAHFLPQIPWSV